MAEIHYAFRKGLLDNGKYHCVCGVDADIENATRSIKRVTCANCKKKLNRIPATPAGTVMDLAREKPVVLLSQFSREIDRRNKLG